MMLESHPFEAFEGKSLEEKVQELCDREELRELIARYAHRVAQGVSVADMFCDDGAFIVRYPGKPPSVSRGRAELNATFANVRNAGGNPLPMIHNYVLRISRDEAVGVCSNELRWSANGESMIGSGYYQDRFRREAGRWKFVERDMTFIHWVPLAEGWAQQAPGSEPK
jgi:hypothetical protein